MSDVAMTVCSECGQPKPVQKLHCAKHDVVYPQGGQCDHCANELAEEYEAKFLKEQEALAKAEADAKVEGKDNATGTNNEKA